MGRSLSPLLRQELDNLDKDADSRRAAMKALKSYAKHLDSKSIPHFLAEVSDTKAAATGLPPGEFTISLYEVLARVHGRNIVPQIGNIMATIMCTLSSSGGSFPLHQACSKVVPAIARYGIDPSTPDEEKASIIASLCKPLCNALMGNQDGTASGAALCLKALVESSNWRFASGEMVNDVCLKVAGAMHDKATRSNAHMGLAMALVKHNGLIAEAYARSIMRSGLQILDGDTAESSSQKRLSAIQMINFFMKFVDPRCISSELGKVIDVMEQCQNDRMPFVRGAAFEASQSAKSIAAQKGSRHEVGTSSMVGSNFHRKREKSPCRGLWSAKGSPASSSIAASPVQFRSPESQNVDSSIMNGSTLTESPVSVGQSSCNFDQNRRTNRRLWSNDGVDVSLKDGLFIQLCSNSKYFEDDLGEVCDSEVTDASFECTDSFAGFVSPSPNDAISRDKTPSPRASERPINIDDVKIYTTPRKLLLSLQSSYDSDSASYEEYSMAKHSSSPSPDRQRKELLESSEEMLSLHSYSNAEERKDKNETVDTQSGNGRTETLSNEGKSGLSTTEVENSSCKASSEVDCKENNVCVTSSRGKARKYRPKFTILLSLIVIVVAVFVALIRIDCYDDSEGLVPT
ncbi:protein SINE1-like [Phragmites australis]|uniref:protein SINE1-like n=1 Tax=Phragmites australis TaxID=29695 RepID=UPI002D7900DF|nr:protein SINE1-like [Phragmites australis]XP_062181853.1 protein SINE1-like [Phragmites australis]XP_062181854.1 protein SINE1-like [Phragmites australis]XP_062181855.1 protein SINE1-like [Phragmites australis]